MDGSIAHGEAGTVATISVDVTVPLGSGTQETTAGRRPHLGVMAVAIALEMRRLLQRLVLVRVDGLVILLEALLRILMQKRHRSGLAKRRLAILHGDTGACG